MQLDAVRDMRKQKGSLTKSNTTQALTPQRKVRVEGERMGETSASAGTFDAELDSGETTRAPQPADDTVLAWSDDAAPDVELERAPWGVAWRRAAVVLAVCLMAAALVVLAWRELPAQRAEEAGPPRADTAIAMAQADAPAPSTEPAVAPGPPLPATTGTVAQKMTTPPPPPGAAVDPDTIYLEMLSDAGVKAPTNEKAIANGHLICQRLDQGNTVQAVVAEVARINPSLDPARSTGVVYAAIDAYCPQYEDRGTH